MPPKRKRINETQLSFGELETYSVLPGPDVSDGTGHVPQGCAPIFGGELVKRFFLELGSQIQGFASSNTGRVAFLRTDDGEIGPKSPLVESNCLVLSLPRGYTLIKRENGLEVWGHPSRLPFESAADFARHVHHLYSLSDQGNESKICQCVRCPALPSFTRSVALELTFRAGEYVWVKWSQCLNVEAYAKYFGNAPCEPTVHWWPAEILEAAPLLDESAGENSKLRLQNYPTPSASPLPDSAELVRQRYAVRLLSFPICKAEDYFASECLAKDGKWTQCRSDHVLLVTIVVACPETFLLPASALYDDARAVLQSFVKSERLSLPIQSKRRTSVCGVDVSSARKSSPASGRARSGSICSLQSLKPPKPSLSSAERLWADSALVFLPQLAGRPIVPLEACDVLNETFSHGLNSLTRRRFQLMLEKNGSKNLRVNGGGSLSVRVIFYSSVAFGAEILHVGDIVKLANEGVFTKRQQKGWLMDPTRPLDSILFQIDTITQTLILQSGDEEVMQHTLRLGGHFQFVYRHGGEARDPLLKSVELPKDWYPATVDIRDVLGRAYPLSSLLNSYTQRVPYSSLMYGNQTLVGSLPIAKRSVTDI